MFLEDKNKLADPISPDAKHDPFSLEGLANWLASKSGPYDWYGIKNCLICQYLDSVGVRYLSVGGCDYVEPSSPYNRIQLPDYFATVAVTSPTTFEAAHLRALSLQSKGK